MKKITTFIMLLTNTLVLVSCNKKSDVLRVGMDLRYPPFETTNDKNKPEGISVDIAHEFVKFIGKKVEIVPMEFGNLIISLQNGSIDVVIASMSVTEERSKVVDFSDSYFYFKIITLLNKQFAVNNNLDEDSTVEQLLEVKSARYVGLSSQVSATIPESLGIEVTKSTNIAAAISEVAQGTKDVLLMSASPVVGGYKSNKDSTLVMWDAFESSPIAMAFKKGNTELLNKSNEFIKTFTNKDGMYDILRKDWDNVILEELERYGLDFYIEE